MIDTFEEYEIQHDSRDGGEHGAGSSCCRQQIDREGRVDKNIDEIRELTEQCIEGALELYSLVTKLHVNSIKVQSDSNTERYEYIAKIQDGLNPRSKK
jgi:hypothetical protein